MARPNVPLATDDARIVSASTPEAPASRRRTLGTCAHCKQPVDMAQDYIRLYRRAWHLDCALASEPQPQRSFD